MIPKEKQPFKLSKIAVSILLASVLLANILAIVTINNIKREENIMANFLLKEGETLIRSFEAGARTSLFYHSGDGDHPLTTLVTETVKMESIAYIRIVNEDGHIIADAGNWIGSNKTRPSIQQVLDQPKAQTTLMEEDNIFEVASLFNPLVGMEKNLPMVQGFHKWCQVDDFAENPTHLKQIIYIGLQTTQFDHARQEDVRHRLIMGGILFLLGCAGFYFLFLYQGMRVARTTLANLQIYTENVIESIPAGLITLDRDGGIVSCNARAEFLAGSILAELKNKKLQDVFPRWDITFDSHEQKTLLDTPLSCPQKENEPIPVRVSSSSLRDSAGEKIGTVLIIRDMRDIHAMEQQLERSRRLAALGQMATGIAHEIRNPLGTLRGFAQYFSKQFSENDDGREFAELMIGEVDRLNHTISALLQFARPRVPEFQNIKLCELLQKTGKLLEQDFASQQMALNIECAGGMTMQADPDLLLQVLINLIKNSMEVTLADGCVELGAVDNGTNLRLWVQDTGRGMSEEEKERMFDPFFTTKKTGTGLGLAVTHQIIEQHHGYFEVISAPKKGTRIDIVFPKNKKG